MSNVMPPPVVHEPPPVGRKPRRPPYLRSAATISAVLGVFIAALGVGIGVRHLTTTGLTWTGVLGLLILLAGLALLAFAWFLFWRATHRWQRLWFIPIVVVALPVMSSVVQGTMLAYAPRNKLGSVTPADRGLSYTDVTFRTSDGLRLSAWFIPSTNHAVVVTMPGSGSTRSATLDQASVLARDGFGVLMVDPRGQGRSGGHAMDAGWYGERDLSAAIAFAQHQSGVDPTRIGVLGLSMGGEAAIGAAPVDPAIRAVVTEGVTHRTAADKAGYLPGGIAGAIQRGISIKSVSKLRPSSGHTSPNSLTKSNVVMRHRRGHITSSHVCSDGGVMCLTHKCTVNRGRAARDCKHQTAAARLGQSKPRSPSSPRSRRTAVAGAYHPSHVEPGVS